MLAVTVDIITIACLIALTLAALLLAISLRRVPIAWEIERRELMRRVAELEAAVSVLQKALVEKDQQREREIKRVRHEFQQKEEGRAINVLLVGVGSDPSYQQDLVAMRSLNSERARVSRLVSVSLQSLTNALNVAREKDAPVRWVHLAVPTNERGALLADGVCTWEQLSEALIDVKILAIMGSYADAAGVLLAGGMRVVSFREQVTAENAAKFSQQFWRAVIEDDKGADYAFDQAIRRVRAVSEYAELR